MRTLIALVFVVLLSGCGVGEQFGRMIEQQGEVATRLYNDGGYKSVVTIKRGNRALTEVNVAFHIDSVADVPAQELFDLTEKIVVDVFGEQPEKLVVQLIVAPNQ